MKKYNISIGFIGGGRITGIILQALQQKGMQCKGIKVYDPDTLKTEKIKGICKEMTVSQHAGETAAADVVFLAVHPPDIKTSLEEIKDTLSSDTVLVSLAPKVKISSITQTLGKTPPLIRMIPNAPSIISKGYNAIAYSGNLDFENNKMHQITGDLLQELGELVYTDDEDKLEAYAVISGMGPSYLWFQFHELYLIAREFGLSNEEARHAVSKMVKGSVETLLETDMAYEEVVDLIPFQPFSQHHNSFREVYRNVLTNMYNKLKQ
ncbi:MAG: pyrroline-5-carboxylate reductase family protein [Bacteroidota bacterium]